MTAGRSIEASVAGVVGEAVAEVSRALRWHAGGVELASYDEAGRVTLRFTGMCTGCALKPMTLAATVRPALLAVPGVTAVDAVGVRLSEEAERRLAALTPDQAGTGSTAPARTSTSQSSSDSAVVQG